MDKPNVDKESLKKFGITMGSALLLITLLVFLKHRHSPLPVLTASACLFILAFTIPILLKPIYIIWMGLARLLSWINTRLILCILFYLLFTPIGLALKLFGRDLLDRKIDKNKESYWRRKEAKEFNRLNYEKQF